jgi:thiol-disulfide isomerase/thioredoxin
MGLFLALSANAADNPGKTGVRAHGFTGKTPEGKAVKLSDYEGKVVLLDFWASWCGPCREEMPFLIDFYRENRNTDLRIIAVNLDDRVENMNRFLSRFFVPPGFLILVDREKEIPRVYDIKAMPTTIFIDKKGTLRFWHSGFNPSHKERFQAELDELLKEK